MGFSLENDVDQHLYLYQIPKFIRSSFHLFKLRAAKRGLTIFEIFQLQKQFLENI